MSVTVEDALKLPSLRNAKIVAGKNGLGKIVSGISVLESADPKTLISDLFQNGDYLASELVITSFYNCIDNVDLQCQIIRRLAEGGEVGLILFYVGVYLPSIARECLDIANELDFPLIQMPENISLRYGEVISDVSECLYHDRTQQVSMASDILARVTVLPEHQRTVNVVLKMLSVHLQASVVLTNADYSILNLAAWPSGMEDTIGKHKDIFRKMGGKTSARYPYVPEGYVYHMSVAPAFSSAMELFLIKEGEPLNYKQQEQAADLVRIGVNIWGKQHSSIVLSELIRAILQDDLWLETARHANAMAQRLAAGLAALGVPVFLASPTNQIFPVFPDAVVTALRDDVAFEFWAKPDERHTAIRFVCSWATDEAQVEALLACVKARLSQA